MNKFTGVIIISLILFSCGFHSKKEKKSGITTDHNCFNYPKVIDSLNFRDLYDSARWLVYTYQGDRLYLPKEDTLKTGSFGELGLKFNKLHINNDTVNIDFYFTDKGQLVLAGSSRGGTPLITGVSFDKRSRRKLAMFSHSGFSFTASGEKSRYENPEQPEIISYIKKNWKKINSCFRELAIIKGLSKE